MERLQSLELRLEARNKLNQLKNDMLVLKNICEHPAACFQSFQAWMQPLQGHAHAQRLRVYWKHR